MNPQNDHTKMHHKTENSEKSETSCDLRVHVLFLRVSDTFDHRAMSYRFTVDKETISLLKSPEVSLFRLSSRVFMNSTIFKENPITYCIFRKKNNTR